MEGYLKTLLVLPWKYQSLQWLILVGDETTYKLQKNDFFSNFQSKETLILWNGMQFSFLKKKNNMVHIRLWFMHQLPYYTNNKDVFDFAYMKNSSFFLKS